MYHHQPSQLLNDLDILIKYSKNKERKHRELFHSPDQ